MIMLSARLYFLLLVAVHAQLPVGTVTTTLAEVADGAFFQAFTNESVTEILVNPKNFVLSREAWSVYNVDNPYRLTRDILIRSAFETAGQLDFQFLSGKVLVGQGVTVTLENLVVRNIRKLGGFSLDFFGG
uniref:Uncharacterized protein n=1 Tax=Tetradesmus obliquus TaxID=3088 RepID=A0A383VEI5_TETOB|eukprot:jgi/Sobl393_1/5620/SZX63074.1